METTFYNEFGELCLRWIGRDGDVYTAVKEQVEFLGKECFEQKPEEEDEYPWLTEEVLKESRNAYYAWLRNEEIM